MEQLRLDRQICFPLWLCAKEITRAYGPLLESLDLTYTQYIAMLFLWQNDSVTAADLGRAMRLDSNTTTPLIERLEQKGYIKRNKSKLDGRQRVVTLTPSGIKLRDAAKDIPFEMAACVALSPDEAMTLHRLLYKIVSRLEENKT